MKIIVLGDTHGSARTVETAVRAADRLGAEKIFQVGDFGIWTHQPAGVRFLDDVNFACEESGIPLVFLDGNHENFDHLLWLAKTQPRNENGHVYLRSKVLYAPRGSTWTWDKKRFMAVGGAVSIDKEWRLEEEALTHFPRSMWWDQEQLTDLQLETIVNKVQILWKTGASIDYLFTHDCPTSAPFGSLIPHADSAAHRQKMDVLGRAIRPALWFHGHMHDKYDGYPFPAYGEEQSVVYGLTCNGMRDNWGLLDTDTGLFTWETQIG